MARIAEIFYTKEMSLNSRISSTVNKLGIVIIHQELALDSVYVNRGKYFSRQ